MAKVTDYQFTGYGIISRGSSVKMFMGTDQQFFLGGKNNMMVGLSNTFTFGMKSDVMVGPSISMGLAPWNWDKPGGLQTGHFTAKYDFSTNKNFAFQIAPEGSSNYVTQSKFNCDEGFQAVAGFQPVGENLYDAYKATLTKMGTVVALTNLVSSLAVFANTLEAPAPPKDDKGELKNDTTRQYLAAAAAYAANAASTGVATYAAISAAIQRETSFKKWIHPQSVIDLQPTHVFLGAMGNITLGQTSGTSLVLKDGRATLGAFNAIAGYPSYAVPKGKKPYKDKFTDFEDPPTTWVSIDPSSIANSATHAILIEAGDRQFLDPALNTLMMLKKASKELQDKTTKAAEKAYDLAMETPNPDQILRVALAKQAQEAVELLALPFIKAAQSAEMSAEAVYLANPSLYLSAGTQTSMLSAIKAKSPNFNVIANSISLSDTDIPIRGLFVKQLPTPSIELVNTPVTHEISMAAGGTTLKFGVSEIQLKPAEIVIENGLGSISVKPTGLTFKVGPVSVQITPYIQKWGSGLKIIGA